LNILEKIIETKRREVAESKTVVPLSTIATRRLYNRSTYSLVKILKTSDSLNIISEYKRASPSKGLINISKSTPESVATGYQKYGAAAISVLTDTQYFKADKNDFSTIRNCTSIPLLRKEFIIDAYQIHEAKAMGADVILLIGAVLKKSESESFVNIAHDLEMEVLYEIHGKEEIDKMPHNVDIVGINNRDLKTFTVDYQHSISMLEMLPAEYPKISESGISNTNTIVELHKSGFNGFLIGEAFMKVDNPSHAFHDFITECHSKLNEI